MKKPVITAAVFVGAAFGIAALTFWAKGFPWLPGNTLKVRGIDISHYQKNIDWKTVGSEGISFVYIKATEGGDWIDKEYESHRQGAKAAGLIVGAYHFFSFCKDGKIQAQNFLAHAQFNAGDLFPVVDIESGGNCREAPEPVELMKELTEFNQEIKMVTGIEPIIYTTWPFYQSYFSNQKTDQKFWIRNLFWKPKREANWVFWQYEISFLRGVKSRVDKDAFYPGEISFQSLLIDADIAHETRD